MKLYASLLPTSQWLERCRGAAPACRGLGEVVSSEPGGQTCPALEWGAGGGLGISARQLWTEAVWPRSATAGCPGFVPRPSGPAQEGSKGWRHTGRSQPWLQNYRLQRSRWAASTGQAEGENRGVPAAPRRRLSPGRVPGRWWPQDTRELRQGLGQQPDHSATGARVLQPVSDSGGVCPGRGWGCPEASRLYAAEGFCDVAKPSSKVRSLSLCVCLCLVNPFVCITFFGFHTYQQYHMIFVLHSGVMWSNIK